MVLAGLGLAALGFAGKHLIYRMPTVTSKFSESLRHLPKFNAETLANSKFYKGGFESKMSKREASLILGVSPTANKLRVSLTIAPCLFENDETPFYAQKLNIFSSYIY